MRISCRLTFCVNFKPLIIKISWELDILCYIFWNSKIWRATFVLFLIFFFNFSVSFYPIWMKIISKFRENVGPYAYCLSLVLNRSWTGLSQKNWEVQDCWSAWTGYSPVLRTGPWSTRVSHKVMNHKEEGVIRCSAVLRQCKWVSCESFLNIVQCVK